jgi:hypothetical protein
VNGKADEFCGSGSFSFWFSSHRGFSPVFGLRLIARTVFNGLLETEEETVQTVSDPYDPF